MFGNVGYLSKAPQFNSVIDINNNLIEGYKNQFVKAVELGAQVYLCTIREQPEHLSDGMGEQASQSLQELRSIDPKSIYSSFDESIDEERAKDFGYNLLAVDALHRGVEWDFNIEPTPKFDLEGVFSLGDWRWANDPIVQFYDRRDNVPVEFVDPVTGDPTGEQAYDTLRIDGLPVGNAAQTQLGMSFTYRPIPGSYVRLRVTQFSDQWADYAPNDAFQSDGVLRRMILENAELQLDGFHGGCPD